METKATGTAAALSRKVDLCAVDGDKTDREFDAGRAGKEKQPQLAILVGFRPAESEITTACFLWKGSTGLEKRSSDIAIVIRELFQAGYKLMEEDRRLVNVPFVAQMQVSIASKSRRVEDIFSSSGSVIMEVYVKPE